MNGGVPLYCRMQVVARLESTRQQDCFYWKENIPKLLQRKQKSNRPPEGLCRLVMVVLLGTMRSQEWTSWLSRGRYWNKPRVISIWSPTKRPVYLDKGAVPPAPVFAVMGSSEMLIFLAPSLCLQNIIKKVIGQKFVYKFVSFPEILKMDPHAVEISRESLLLQDSDCKMPSESRDQHKHSLSALKSTSRNEYIHSGLYSSFTINSLQNQPDPYKTIKTEKLEEKSEGNTPVEEVRTVIRFVTNKTDKQVTRPMVSLPSTSETAAASAFLNSSVSAKISSLMLPNSASISSPSSSSSRSPSLSPTSPLPTEHRSFFLDSSCHDSDSLEPLNLSSGSKAKSPSLPPKAKKPKGLEISAPPMILSGTDIGSIALNSPALPSGSLTPAFFTAQVGPAWLQAFPPCGQECQLYGPVTIWWEKTPTYGKGKQQCSEQGVESRFLLAFVPNWVWEKPSQFTDCLEG